MPSISTIQLISSILSLIQFKMADAVISIAHIQYDVQLGGAHYADGTTGMSNVGLML